MERLECSGTCDVNAPRDNEKAVSDTTKHSPSFGMFFTQYTTSASAFDES